MGPKELYKALKFYATFLWMTHLQIILIDLVETFFWWKSFLHVKGWNEICDQKVFNFALKILVSLFRMCDISKWSVYPILIFLLFSSSSAQFLKNGPRNVMKHDHKDLPKSTKIGICLSMKYSAFFLYYQCFRNYWCHP